MPSIISPRTYEKLKKVFKDEEALISFLEDLNKEFEKFESISKEYKENIENNLYSRLVQKLPTKEELKSEIKRLENEIKHLQNEIKHLENEIGNLKEFTQKLVTKDEFRIEIKRLENKIESESKRLEAELKRLENKIEAETKRLEDKIENLKQTIDIKFKIVIGLIILGFTIFNPNFITILKMFLSLFN